jgi:hypothetical protein
VPYRTAELVAPKTKLVWDVLDPNAARQHVALSVLHSWWVMFWTLFTLILQDSGTPKWYVLMAMHTVCIVCYIKIHVKEEVE